MLYTEYTRVYTLYVHVLGGGDLEYTKIIPVQGAPGSTCIGGEGDGYGNDWRVSSSPRHACAPGT